LEDDSYSNIFPSNSNIKSNQDVNITIDYKITGFPKITIED